MALTAGERYAGHNWLKQAIIEMLQEDEAKEPDESAIAVPTLTIPPTSTP